MSVISVRQRADSSGKLGSGENFYFGAIEGTRTPTPLPVHGPEPCASANSATMAILDRPIFGPAMQRRPEGRRVSKINFSILQAHHRLSNAGVRERAFVRSTESSRDMENTVLLGA